MPFISTLTMDSCNYYYIADNTIRDIIKAPNKVVFSSLLSGGEIVAIDEFDDVHFQLSKFNWRTVTSKEGGWFGLQCLIEFQENYLVCTSGAGLKEINKKNGKVSSSTMG